MIYIPSEFHTDINNKIVIDCLDTDGNIFNNVTLFT